MEIYFYLCITLRNQITNHLKFTIMMTSIETLVENISKNASLTATIAIREFLMKHGYALTFENAETINGFRIVSIRTNNESVFVHYIYNGENVFTILEQLPIADIEHLSFFIAHNTTESYGWMCTDDDEGFRQVGHQFYKDIKAAYADMKGDAVDYIETTDLEDYDNDIEIHIKPTEINVGGMKWRIIKTKVFK